MNSKANPFTLRYTINDINYYAICAENSIFLTKNSDGKLLRVDENDKDILRKLLEKAQRQKYKFVKNVEYKGQRFKEYLNQIDGLLYFTAQQDDKEVACPYEEYPELYDRANFMRNSELIEEKEGGSDEQNGEQWKILEDVPQEEVEDEGEELATEMSAELAKSLDANSEKLRERCPWAKKAAKIFVTIALGVSMALSITACGNSRANTVHFDPDSAIIYQIDNVNGSDKLDVDVIEDILSDNGFDDEVISGVVEDYETRLGIDSGESDVEIDSSNETARRAMEAIESNSNLSESDKAFLEENFASWISANSAFLDKDCIERLANLKIVYNTEEGAARKYGASGFTGSLQDDGTIARYHVRHNGEPSLLGIVVNNTDPDSMEAKTTLSHEFIHVLMTHWPEGMVELYNPIKADGDTYRQQQLAMVMLQEIYGEAALKEAFLRDETLSTLAENESESSLFRGLLYGMTTGLGDSGGGLADYLEPLEKLYEAKHPGEKAADNSVFNLCKGIFDGINPSDIVEEGEYIDHFVYKDGKLYVACKRAAKNDVNPVLEWLGWQKPQYASISRLVPVEQSNLS